MVTPGEIQRLRQTPWEVVIPLKRWTKEEDMQLAFEYETGVGLSEIALRHNRSESAILHRIKKLGLFVRANIKPDWIL